jgi:hypothetical protein
MMMKSLAAAAGLVLATLAFTAPAHALTMAECSDKYQAAKADGSAKDVKWNDFRKAQCGPDAKPVAAAVPAAKAAPADTAEVADPEAAPANAPEPAAPTAKAPKGVSFPKAVDAKYASESAGKARMHTCVDSYHANKDKGTLNGLKWIQKGGGFYSLCNAALKK